MQTIDVTSTRMKSTNKFQNLVKTARQKNLNRDEFLATLHPSDRHEGAMHFDQAMAYEAAGVLESDDHAGISHFTLNTRHLINIPFKMVRPETFTLLLSLVRNGGGRVGCPGYECDVRITREGKNKALYTLYRAGVPITTNGWAGNAAASEDVWHHVEQTWLQMTDYLPVMDTASHLPIPEPPGSPWIATVLWPTVAFHQLLPPDYLGMVGHLEACLGVVLQVG